MKHHLVVAFDLPGDLSVDERHRLTSSFIHAVQIVLSEDLSNAAARVPVRCSYVGPPELPRATRILIEKDEETGHRKVWYLKGAPPSPEIMHAANELYCIDAQTAEVERKKYFPTDLALWCPNCGERHIDEGEWRTRVHTTHKCEHCHHEWRPHEFPTMGVPDGEAP